MNSDDLEQQLRRQPFRAAPSHWREEILGRATTTARARNTGRSNHRLAGLLREWLWPSPVAWGTVAAAWAVVVLLNLVAAEPARDNSQRASVAFARFAAECRMRQALMLEVLDLPGPVEPSAPIRRPTGSNRESPDSTRVQNHENTAQMA